MSLLNAAGGADAATDSAQRVGVDTLGEFQVYVTGHERVLVFFFFFSSKNVKSSYLTDLTKVGNSHMVPALCGSWLLLATAD